jgi:hypothetical protein
MTAVPVGMSGNSNEPFTIKLGPTLAAAPVQRAIAPIAVAVSHRMPRLTSTPLRRIAGRSGRPFAKPNAGAQASKPRLQVTASAPTRSRAKRKHLSGAEDPAIVGHLGRLLPAINLARVTLPRGSARSSSLSCSTAARR